MVFHGGFGGGGHGGYGGSGGGGGYSGGAGGDNNNWPLAGGGGSYIKETRVAVLTEALTASVPGHGYVTITSADNTPAVAPTQPTYPA